MSAQKSPVHWRVFMKWLPFRMGDTTVPSYRPGQFPVSLLPMYSLPDQYTFIYYCTLDLFYFENTTYA